MSQSNTQSQSHNELYRRVRGARIECERLELQIEATVKRALAICAAILASACGQVEFDATTLDASIVVDEPAPVAADADAGATKPAASQVGGESYHLGDECFCCVWAPGTSYPNGDVYCMHGVVDNPVGYMCRAHANDAAPSWAPTVKLCGLDNPWGKK